MVLHTQNASHRVVDAGLSHRTALHMGAEFDDGSVEVARRHEHVHAGIHRTLDLLAVLGDRVSDCGQFDG